MLGPPSDRELLTLRLPLVHPPLPLLLKPSLLLQPDLENPHRHHRLPSPSSRQSLPHPPSPRSIPKETSRALTPRCRRAAHSTPRLVLVSGNNRPLDRNHVAHLSRSFQNGGLTRRASEHYIQVSCSAAAVDKMINAIPEADRTTTQDLHQHVL
jgi:hypothetical protein